MHAVAKHLDGVDLHVAQVASGFRHFQRLVVHAIIQSLLGLYPAPKVDVDGLKESLPLVAQRQSPVVALEGEVQLGGLPVGETVLVDGDVPALRVASSEGVDVEGEGRLKGAVLCKADLEGYSQEHVHHVGLVLVALQGQQHPLSPRRVEPAVESHVITDEDGVDLRQKQRHFNEEFGVDWPIQSAGKRIPCCVIKHRSNRKTNILQSINCFLS